MPGGELLYQKDMFTGDWVDNRTSRQKRQDREREQPQQIELFSQREIAQFGVNAHPLLPLSPHTKLGLIFEDPRTEEEKERDLQRAAEEKTFQMFEPPVADSQTLCTPDTNALALVPYQAPCLALTVIEKLCHVVVPYIQP
jgi:hypothetical protein